MAADEAHRLRRRRRAVEEERLVHRRQQREQRQRNGGAGEGEQAPPPVAQHVAEDERAESQHRGVRREPSSLFRRERRVLRPPASYSEGVTSSISSPPR